MNKKWKNFINEKVWADYEEPKGQWKDVPLSDLEHDPDEYDLTDEMYNLIATAYAKIGGHVNIKGPADVPDKYDQWSAVDLDGDPEPDALRVASTKPAGTKLTVSGHDGTRIAKNAYTDKTADMLNKDGYFAEMSDAIAHIMITRYNIESVNDKETVEKVLGKSVDWVGPHPEGKYPEHTGWYVRKLSGKVSHMKIMLGKPKVG